jgi:hypothetical protein
MSLPLICSETECSIDPDAGGSYVPKDVHGAEEVLAGFVRLQWSSSAFAVAYMDFCLGKKTLANIVKK